MIGEILSGALTEIIVGLVMALLGGGGLLAWGRHKRNQGREDAVDDFDKADRAEADAIRNRVEREHADRVREFRNRGYRDGG
jgi:Na+/glutamate symporter